MLPSAVIASLSVVAKDNPSRCVLVLQHSSLGAGAQQTKDVINDLA
jgi:hypothetical protein